MAGQAISRREAEILQLLGEHLTNAEIADRLVISIRTVESHVAALMRKLDAPDRRALARLAEARQATASHSSLPNAMTPFIGREALVSEILAAIAAARLVTLTGPGGAGKTRTAIEAARRLAESDGIPVWFVDLAPLTSTSDIEDALSSVLGVRPEPGRRALDAVAGELGRGRCLLLLDNGEHLVREVGSLAALLLRRVAGLRVLLTSRESVALAGERVVQLHGLTTPAHDARAASIAESEAVRLFADRARAVRPDADPLADADAVASIVRRLDGLPLAIELAAANVLALDPRQIDERLRDRFTLLSAGGADPDPRHGTLRTALDWSYQLLVPSERALFDMLAVFRGSFSLEALEAVHAGTSDAGAGPTEASVGAQRVGSPGAADVAADLAALVRKSLVTVAPSSPDAPGRRFRLLETVREFAAERLEASGAAATWRDRHLAWAIGLINSVTAGFHGPDQLPAYRRMDADLDNVEAALEWAVLDPERASAALIPVLLLQSYWLAVGTRRERGARWARQMSEAATSRPAWQRASGLRLAATLVMFSDLDQADALVALSAQLAGDEPLGRAHARLAATLVGTLRGERFPDWTDEAIAAGLPAIHVQLLRLYLAASLSDDPRRAWIRLLEVADGMDALGDAHMASSCRAVAADFGAHAGEGAAVEVLRMAFEAARAFGCLSCISAAASLQPLIDPSLTGEERLALAREGVTSADAIGEVWAVLMAVEALAAVLAEAGELERALVLVEACATARRASGHVSILPTHAVAGARAAALARDRLAPDEVQRLAARGRRMDYRAMVTLAVG